MDFGALPPEINSGRIYAGPGSAPLRAAATAWAGLAAELHSTATTYASVVADLTTSAWHGPSAAAMTAAATPYAAWLATTAARAEETALQATAAASAYEAAFAATVPPPVIAANRTLLATLVATNFLGQNTPAIAATEVHYEQMWAQDAAAMYSYAGSSAAATQLTGFTAAPETTNAGGEARRSAAAAANTAQSSQSPLSELISQVPATLHALTANPAALSAAATQATSTLQNGMDGVTKFLKVVDGPYSPLGILRLFKNWWQVSSSLVSTNNGAQSLTAFFNPKPITGALSPLLASELLTGAPGVSPAGVSAATGAIGRAGMVGSLSVPTSWAAAAPGVQTVTSVTAATAAQAAPAMAMAVNGQSGMAGAAALSSLAGRAFGAPLGHAVGATAVRTIGTVTHVTNTAVAPDIATTATIIVIPPIQK